VRELDPGLWHWAAPHPDWEASEPWEETVSSHAVDGDAQRLVERHGLPVFAPPPDTAQELLDKYGITADRALAGA
jgi:hypothetical protein